MKTIGKIFLWLIGIFLVMQIIGIAVVYYSRRIEPKTVLTLKVSGAIEEQAPRDALSQLLLGQPKTVTDIVEALDRAATDSRITGLEMRVGESTLGMADIQEIRKKIRDFNAKGKFSVAYLELGTNRSYYLASACQTVILLPASMLRVRGMMTSTTFLRGTFDKLGIYPDMYHAGDYKNAANVYTDKKYTPAHREADQTLLEDLYHQYLRDVAESRGLTAEEVERIIAKGPFSSREALDAKLVDRVAYEDEVRTLVKQKNNGSENRLSEEEYLQRTDRRGRHKLAVIYATGMIVPGDSGDSPLGGSVMGSESMAKQFRHAREDSSVQAVVVRVDSPGGVVYPSEVIRRELELTKRKKPVVISMSDVAASGGYWISMSANRIVAEPGTITGSIGVLGGKMNLMGLYQKLGLSVDHLTTAENATIDWPFQNFTPAQRESMQKDIHEIYQNFLQGVAEGRRMDVAAVEKVAQGRVWTGERAKQLGLVDELGGMDTAINAAKALAKIPAGEQVTLIYLPPPKSLLESLSELFAGGGVRAKAISPRAWLERIESLARLPGWALLPAVPEVQ